MKLDLCNETVVEIPQYSTKIGVETLSSYSGTFTDSENKKMKRNGN